MKYTVHKYINSFITEIKIDFRSRINILVLIITMLVCGFECFYVMLRDNVYGNSIALSSWITQIYIILGIAYGILISESETKEITELLVSLKMELIKRICKIAMVILETLIIYLICVFCVNMSFRIQGSPSIMPIMAAKYILLYWMIPFVISSLFGLIIAHKINSKAKYAIGVMVIIISGPMLPTLLEPLVDTRTGMYKYVAFLNIGPLNVSKPINLIFGYSWPVEKIIILFSLVLGNMIIFLFGSKMKKMIKFFGLSIGFFTLIFSYYLNFRLIVNNYDYEIAMKMYEVYSQEIKLELNNNYRIETINIDIKESINSFKFSSEFVISDVDNISYITFMLYHDFQIEQVYIDDEIADFSREKDLVILSNNFERGESYTIRVIYEGIPAIHMYSDRKNWILPAYFAWYPMQGDFQNIIYQNDLFSVDFVSVQPEENIYFGVKYTGKATPNCNLAQNGLYNWFGYTKGITLLSSEWMETQVIDGNTFIYPLLCKNYNSNVKEYAVQLDEYNEMFGENRESSATYMFTCDTTYTGHGEQIRSVGNHVLIEITRAYIDGNELMNPNLGIYALIKDKYLPYANDVDLEYIFKCAFISSMIKRGQLDSNVLVRDLNDLFNMYNDNGYEQLAFLIFKINEFIEESNVTQVNIFFEDFSAILNSKDYSADDILGLMER